MDTAPTPEIEPRVSRLESDVAEIRAVLARLEPLIIRMDERLSHLATKAELEALRGEVKVDIAALRGDLARKPGHGAMWGMGLALFGLVVAAMAAGAAYLPLVLPAGKG